MQDRVKGSFRDPSGFVYWNDDVLLRQINSCYMPSYDLLVSSGLYASLTKKKMLIPHKEISDVSHNGSDIKIIAPEIIPFISYPYEWCFSQLKDAALLTLDIAIEALSHGMILKDSSAYNVQFVNGKPVFIDTLSFEPYITGEPWIAYRQFCQHFLAPLALMSLIDPRLIQLLKSNIDGIPLDIASKLLPAKTLLNFGLTTHIRLHAQVQKKYESSGKEASDSAIKRGSISKHSLLGILHNLRGTTESLKLRSKNTEWGDYYSANNNYSSEAFECKKSIVREWLQHITPKSVWDIGGNCGVFSQIASDTGALTLSLDIDHTAVEMGYLQTQKYSMKIMPLWMDITNPSPSIGWTLAERMSLVERGPVDTIMALALLHHIAISSNVPLLEIANFFSNLCKTLIIEFVPKSDSQVKILLATRKDVFPEYTSEGFEKAFSNYFNIIERREIIDSARTLYKLERK